jgi:hypothetical protein
MCSQGFGKHSQKSLGWLTVYKAEEREALLFDCKISHTSALHYTKTLQLENVNLAFLVKI